MSLTLNTEVGIGLDVCVKDEKPKTLTVSRGLLPLERGHDITQRRGSSLFVLMMVRKAVIGGVSENKWYRSHAMDRLRSLREDNVVRRIYCCASSRSGRGWSMLLQRTRHSEQSWRHRLSLKLGQSVDGGGNSVMA